MSVEENKAIVRRYFEELWNNGDLAFIEECMGPDISCAWCNLRLSSRHFYSLKISTKT